MHGCPAVTVSPDALPTALPQNFTQRDRRAGLLLSGQ
jgi:hypothetical protein